jgi:hypothetical protein
LGTYDGKLLVGVAFMVAHPVLSLSGFLGLVASFGGNSGDLLLFLAWPTVWVWTAVSAYQNAKRQISHSYVG